MTEPVRPLAALIARWRKYADREGAIYASGIYMCADELAALLQAAAPPAQTAEAASPAMAVVHPAVPSNGLPPSVPNGEDSGTIPAAPPAPTAEHPPLHADEAGDWVAANNGVGARIQMLERALGNCYMMSKREIARLLNRSPMDVGVKSDQLTLERWNHVKRFCEETGQKSSILRATLPTEITEG